MKRVDVVAKSNLSLPAKWLAVFMLRHKNRDGEVVTTAVDIEDWTGLRRTSIRYGIVALEHKGFIETITPFRSGPNSSARFRVLDRNPAPSTQFPDETPHDIRSLVSGGAEKALEPRVRADLAPLSLSSQSSLFSPGEEKASEESVSEIPAWLTNLRTAPSYDLNRDAETRLIERVKSGVFTTHRLAEASTALAAKWESIKWSPSNRRGYKRIDLTFFNWLSREGMNGNGKSQGHVSSIEAGRAGGFADSSRYET